MRNLGRWLLRLIEAAIITILANEYSIGKMTNFKWLLPLLLLFLFINIVPSVFNAGIKSKRLRICGNGCELLILFLISTGVSVVYSIMGFTGKFLAGSLVSEPKIWTINTLIVVLTETVVFWNGIIRVYLTSAQLGIKNRVIGIICGWIPVVHLVALGMIIRTASREVRVENDKLLLNEKRKQDEICRTKYPILLVHGVFFRDYRYLNYWGRIPKELEKNGAVLFYGRQQSAASVEESGREIAARIKEILEETGAEKVNIIAHSKGGLDSRYAISQLDIAPYVASLTTINTPHYGCEFAEYLLEKIPKNQQDTLAGAYNSALRKLGDHNPDFMAAVADLTACACEERNKMVLDMEGVYYQSVGSKLNFAGSGRFPLNFSYRLVKSFDGKNDGLVGEKSFPWGENYQFLMVEGKRGISHGDMIDLNRENLKDFDVREFYVQLVADLKAKGF